MFNGHWSRIYYDSNNDPMVIFCLTLKQNGDTVKGEHFITLAYGDFIDEYEDSINGIAKDSVAIINIRTGRCTNKDIDHAIGKAKLKIIEGDSIRFTLLEAPDWEHFFPDCEALPRYKGEE